MIDYFALALGHGLLAIALIRLVLRAGLDEDPLVAAIKADTADNRTATSAAGRNAARRGRGAVDADGAGDGADDSEVRAADAASRAQAAQR